MCDETQTREYYLKRNVARYRVKSRLKCNRKTGKSSSHAKTYTHSERDFSEVEEERRGRWWEGEGNEGREKYCNERREKHLINKRDDSFNECSEGEMVVNYSKRLKCTVGIPESLFDTYPLKFVDEDDRYYLGIEHIIRFTVGEFFTRALKRTNER